MKASELRIGNYVSLHGVLVEMTASDFNFDESYFKPIPLTEEWLLKFGFVRRGITSNLGKFTLHHKEAMYPNGRVYFNSWAILEKIPDYVHQLQNLYFALTNEELTYEQQK